MKTMACESKHFTVIDGQSEIKADGPNGRENSWGVAQFWLDKPMETPKGTPITKAMAQDPEIALDLAAWHFSEGRGSKWSCY